MLAFYAGLAVTRVPQTMRVDQQRRPAHEMTGRSALSRSGVLLVAAIGCSLGSIWTAPPVIAAAAKDVTAVALDRCLADPAKGSTGDQTDCEAAAEQAYDRRMNQAYAALLKRLPPDVGARMRTSQRAWLAYRDQEAKAREALYATRHGTMYVPMESDDAVTLVGDRARLLERYLRTLNIE
ncbi:MULTISPECIES: lysozyme inhibitor LprI family protein [unclassified Rhizobium]|uniref:lysozyme inhibitor LprI family protein n=2 Tax=Rhizobium TaxID=379 RepID=UPI0037F83C26